jgi:hypothetical protein
MRVTGNRALLAQTSSPSSWPLPASGYKGLACQRDAPRILNGHTGIGLLLGKFPRWGGLVEVMVDHRHGDDLPAEGAKGGSINSWTRAEY